MNYKDDKKNRKVKKNTVNKYMTDIRPDRLTTCQSEWKSVVSQRASVYQINFYIMLSVYILKILTVIKVVYYLHNKFNENPSLNSNIL
jgi:hypothetical protein